MNMHTSGDTSSPSPVTLGECEEDQSEITDNCSPASYGTRSPSGARIQQHSKPAPKTHPQTPAGLSLELPSLTKSLPVLDGASSQKELPLNGFVGGFRRLVRRRGEGNGHGAGHDDTSLSKFSQKVNSDTAYYVPPMIIAYPGEVPVHVTPAYSDVLAQNALGLNLPPTGMLADPLTSPTPAPHNSTFVAIWRAIDHVADLPWTMQTVVNDYVPKRVGVIGPPSASDMESASDMPELNSSIHQSSPPSKFTQVQPGSSDSRRTYVSLPSPRSYSIPHTGPHIYSNHINGSSSSALGIEHGGGPWQNITSWRDHVDAQAVVASPEQDKTPSLHEQPMHHDAPAIVITPNTNDVPGVDGFSDLLGHGFLSEDREGVYGRVLCWSVRIYWQFVHLLQDYPTFLS